MDAIINLLMFIIGWFSFLIVVGGIGYWITVLLDKMKL